MVLYEDDGSGVLSRDNPVWVDFIPVAVVYIHIEAGSQSIGDAGDSGTRDASYIDTRLILVSAKQRFDMRALEPAVLIQMTKW
jgi:hypothetical protein